MLRTADPGLVAHRIPGYSPKKAEEILGMPDPKGIVWNIFLECPKRRAWYSNIRGVKIKKGGENKIE